MNIKHFHSDTIETAVGKSKNQPHQFLIAILFITLLLAACRSPSQPASGNTGGEQNNFSSANNSASENTTNAGSLPGTEEFGLSQPELVTSIEAVEAHIAACMSEAGFEYIAADYNTMRRGMTADKSLPGLSEKQYFAQYGYGISTLYTGLPPQLADLTTPAQIGLGERNVQIFKNLSAADQVAYNHTLFGENINATFAVAIEIEDFARTGGCTRSGIEKVFSPEQLQATYYNPKDALIEQDPRLIAAIGEYSNCLRAAGYDYNHEPEIEPDLRNRLDRITDGLPVESLSTEARSALTELQGYERALAVVAFDCEVRILEPVEDQVERELFAR